VFWSAANLLDGVVLILLVIDPTHPLVPILALLAAAVVLPIWSSFLPPDQ
jgi:hypothetical protein